MTNRISLDQLAAIQAYYQSVLGSEGASQIGIEDVAGNFVSPNVEGALQEIGSGSVGGGSMLMDIVPHNFTGSTGSVVLNHQLGSTPQFVYVQMSGEPPGGMSSYSHGFWQDNGAGTFQTCSQTFGSEAAVHDNYCGIVVEGGYYPTNNYVRVSVTAADSTTITINREKAFTYFNTVQIRLRLMLYA